MRKNLFDLIYRKNVNLKQEYNRLYNFFENTQLYYKSNMLSCIEPKFLSWKYRNRYTSIDEMMYDLQISNMFMKNNITLEKLLLYIEFIDNAIEIIDRSIIHRNDIDIITALINNYNSLLEELNYEIKRNDKGQSIIVEKDKISTAVSEIDNSITNEVIEYRRFSMKGNVEEKRKILKQLADKVEALKTNFKGTTYNNIIEDTTFLLNNLNIRHNNIEGKEKKQYVVDIKDEELEKWYDKTYDMILSVIIINEYLKDKDNIKDLKSKIVS